MVSATAAGAIAVVGGIVLLCAFASVRAWPWSREGSGGAPVLPFSLAPILAMLVLFVGMLTLFIGAVVFDVEGLSAVGAVIAGFVLVLGASCFMWAGIKHEHAKD